MNRFKNILLIYECDPATVEQALAIARANQANLTIVQVVRDLPAKWRKMNLGGGLLDLQELAVAEYQTRLEEFVAPLRQAGVHVSTRVIVGTPFLEIIREVIANDRDLVIMTADGRESLKERLFGSTSMHLIRKCPCPVWVMKPTSSVRVPRVMAAIDPDPDDGTRQSLNAKILQVASDLAALAGGELHVVHAWTLLYENLMRGRGGFSETEIRECAQLEERRQRDAMQALLAENMDGMATVHVVEGAADLVIPQVAKEQRADLLVMGTVCRVGIPGFFIGNTAEKILNEMDCSVLTLKPDGFVSPVQVA